MGGIASVLYGAVVYLLFFGTFLYAIAFTGNLPVPKTIDSGPEGPLVPAMVIDTLLLGLFAIQHSVMARPAFKRWWTRFVPRAVERTTYVLLASLVLVALFVHWHPILAPVWSVTNPAGTLAIQVVFWLGYGLVLLSTFLLNHFELFGLRQVWARSGCYELYNAIAKVPQDGEVRGVTLVVRRFALTPRRRSTPRSCCTRRSSDSVKR